MLVDSPLPYALKRKFCDHCKEWYDGSANSNMCRACDAGRPGRERRQRNNARSAARQRARRAAVCAR